MGEGKRRRSITGPLLLISIGLFFLLSNLGLITLDFWEIVFRFWPVLLIAAGLDILLGQRSAWGSALALVIVLAIFAGGIVLFDAQSTAPGAENDIAIPLGKVDEALLTLEPALGYLQLDALEEESTMLMSGQLQPFVGEDIRESVDISGTRAAIHLKTAGITAVPFLSESVGQPSWDLAFHPGVAAELSVDLGVGKVELDLGELHVESVDAEYGLGQAVLTLPAKDDLEVRVEGGIGEIAVFIPDDAGIRLHAEVGLGNVKVPSSFTRDGEYYLSPDYASAEVRIELTLNLGIGSIQVR
jgi:hypothetical protein